MQGQLAFVQQLPVVHHHEQFQGTPRDGVIRGDTDAVLQFVEGHRRIFHLGGSHLETTYVDHIVLTSLQVQLSFLVDDSDIRGVHRLVSQDGGCPLWVTHIAAHQCITLTGNQSPLGDEESRVLHGSAQTTRYTFAMVVVIRGDDARLRRGIGVIKPCLRQQFTQLLHIGLCDGSCPRLNEIHLVGHLRQLFAAELYQHSDAGRHEEGRHLLSRIVEGCEESVHVLQTVHDDEGCPQDDDRVDLRQTADMIQRTVHHESQFVGESLTVDQVFRISHDGAMTDHHPLRLSSRACGVKDIRRSLRS